MKCVILEKYVSHSIKNSYTLRQYYHDRMMIRIDLDLREYYN